MKEIKQYIEIENETDDDYGRQWFAIQTHALKEKVAKANYENQGFIAYLPQIRSVRKHSRRIDHVKKAFFPGYLFLHLSPTERQWQTISSTRGTSRPVRFGDHYPPVPDWVIEELYSLENEDGLISLNEVNKEIFNPGDKVKIFLASDIERTGIFKELHGNERALILLDILQEQAKAVVPLSSLYMC